MEDGLVTDPRSSKVVALVVVGLLACGDAGPADDIDAGSVGDAGSAAMAFEIIISEYRGAGGESGFAYATVYNPFRGDGSWTVAASEGDCVFNQPQAPDFCDPACVLPEHCGADGECHPSIEPQSAGDIEVTGLRSALTLAVEGPYFYYLPEFDPEPEDGDLFDPGDAIEASAPGADVARFEVATTGVADLVTPLPCDLGLTAGHDLEVTWTPAGAGDTILLVLQSGNHGLQFSSIVCETGDDGSLTVGASLIGAFLAEWRPVESWRMSRYRDGSIRVGDVDVELRAMSTTGCTY
jgi:hypothetical protein